MGLWVLFVRFYKCYDPLNKCDGQFWLNSFVYVMFMITCRVYKIKLNIDSFGNHCSLVLNYRINKYDLLKFRKVAILAFLVVALKIKK